MPSLTQSIYSRSSIYVNNKVTEAKVLITTISYKCRWGFNWLLSHTLIPHFNKPLHFCKDSICYPYTPTFFFEVWLHQDRTDHLIMSPLLPAMHFLLCTFIMYWDCLIQDDAFSLACWQSKTHFGLMNKTFWQNVSWGAMPLYHPQIHGSSYGHHFTMPYHIHAEVNKALLL